MSKFGRRRACKKAHVSYHAFLGHIARDPVFAAEVEEAEQDWLDDIEDNVLTTARTDANIGLKVLRVKRPKEWSDKQIISHEGNVTVRIVEDESWYNNRAHDQAAKALAPPVASIVESIPIQGSGVRPEVGQNRDGAADGH